MPYSVWNPPSTNVYVGSSILLVQSNIPKFLSDTHQCVENWVFKRNAQLTDEEMDVIIEASQCLNNRENWPI